MTKNQIRNTITKIHFYFLGFALLNFVLKSTIEISLNYKLAYGITLLVYLSGIILFFLNLNPFKKIRFYFSIYIITPILTLLFWFFGGIFFALLTSIFLYPIYPDELKMKNEKLTIYQKYQGFMSGCCLYELTEKKYWFLEKKIMEINLYSAIDFEKASLNSKGGKIGIKSQFQ